MPLILIFIGIVLIVYNYKQIKKNNNIDAYKEDKDHKKFNDILSINKKELSDYRLELGILRKNIGESLTELQEEILEIKKELNIVKNDDDLHDNNLYTDKSNNIKKLLEKGLTEEEICHKLSIGKGEVLLVRDLFRQ